MPSQQVTPQNIAAVAAKSVLYVPKGIIFPIVDLFDQIKDLLTHEDIACAYCHKQNHTSESARSKIAKVTQAVVFRGQQWLAEQIEQVILLSIWLLTLIFPLSVLNNINNSLQDYAGRWAKQALGLHELLSTYRNKIIWYGIFPLSLLIGCAWLYGLGIIPEIYAFIAGSYWGGKIINHAANLLVRQKDSDEWAFFKNPIISSSTFKNVAIRLAMDICLLSVIQKFYQFVGYCFQAFFAWLLFYVAVKKAGDESSIMMDNLGHELKRENFPLTKCRPLKNAFWLVSFYAFRTAASNNVYQRYEELHEKRHVAQPQISPQVLNENMGASDITLNVAKARTTPRRSSRLLSLARTY